MAKAHERPDPESTFHAGRKSWLTERMLLPGVERKPLLAERMPA
jgi:hypothetical protein